uniref:Cyclin N-terminal domain-containing protein n=1 Tax=Mycena chlorophos TaxID=658473 RepID=A0ABQ0LWW9_MYCCL|nr:predicted protein [Mycena chlorophos]
MSESSEDLDSDPTSRNRGCIRRRGRSLSDNLSFKAERKSVESHPTLDTTMTIYSSHSTLPRARLQAHPASLVDPASHSPALLELVGIELTGPVIYYLCDSVLQVVNVATDGYFDKRTHFPLFCNFADLIISDVGISTSTTLVALVYLARVCRLDHLVIDEDEEDGALERLLLGALVVANKYTREDAMKNMYWALASRIFATCDVSRFERDFLELLEWDLSVSEDDLMRHHRDAMAMASLALAVSRRPTRCRRPSVASEATIRAVPSLVPSSPVSTADQLARSPSPSPISLQTPHLRHVELAVVEERRCPQRGPGKLRRGKGFFRQLVDGLRIPRYRRVQQSLGFVVRDRGEVGVESRGCTHLALDARHRLRVPASQRRALSSPSRPPLCVDSALNAGLPVVGSSKTPHNLGGVVALPQRIAQGLALRQRVRNTLSPRHRSCLVPGRRCRKRGRLDSFRIRASLRIIVTDGQDFVHANGVGNNAVLPLLRSEDGGLRKYQSVLHGGLQTSSQSLQRPVTPEYCGVMLRLFVKPSVARSTVRPNGPFACPSPTGTARPQHDLSLVLHPLHSADTHYTMWVAGPWFSHTASHLLRIRIADEAAEPHRESPTRRPRSHIVVVCVVDLSKIVLSPNAAKPSGVECVVRIGWLLEGLRNPMDAPLPSCGNSMLAPFPRRAGQCRPLRLLFPRDDLGCLEPICLRKRAFGGSGSIAGVPTVQRWTLLYCAAASQGRIACDIRCYASYPQPRLIVLVRSRPLEWSLAVARNSTWRVVDLLLPPVAAGSIGRKSPHTAHRSLDQDWPSGFPSTTQLLMTGNRLSDRLFSALPPISSSGPPVDVWARSRAYRQQPLRRHTPIGVHGGCSVPGTTREPQPLPDLDGPSPHPVSTPFLFDPSTVSSRNMSLLLRHAVLLQRTTSSPPILSSPNTDSNGVTSTNAIQPGTGADLGPSLAPGPVWLIAALP